MERRGVVGGLHPLMTLEAVDALLSVLFVLKGAPGRRAYP
jgi:hypothetical protein